MVQDWKQNSRLRRGKAKQTFWVRSLPQEQQKCKFGRQRHHNKRYRKTLKHSQGYETALSHQCWANIEISFRHFRANIERKRDRVRIGLLCSCICCCLYLQNKSIVNFEDVWRVCRPSLTACIKATMDRKQRKNKKTHFRIEQQTWNRFSDEKNLAPESKTWLNCKTKISLI